MPDDHQQLIVWVTASEVEDVRRIAASHGVTVEKAQISGILPVILIPLIIIGVAAAVGLVDHEIEVHRGGQVIDLSGPAPKFYRSRDVQYGLILVVKKDGTVRITVNNVKGLFGEVLDALQKILTDVSKETVDKAAEAIQAVVGDKAQVAVETHQAPP